MIDRVFSDDRIRPAPTARRGGATPESAAENSPGLIRSPRSLPYTLHARSLIRTNPSAAAFIHRLSRRCEQVPHRKEER